MPLAMMTKPTAAWKIIGRKMNAHSIGTSSGPERMDHVHPRLERPAVVPGQDRRVGQQVDDEKRPDRDQSGQGKQPVDQELVPFQKGRRG